MPSELIGVLRSLYHADSVTWRGRTTTIAAAVSAWLELAGDAEEALTRIRAVRPFATLSREQETALIRYLASTKIERKTFILPQTEKP
jgi:hypothetical protein